MFKLLKRYETLVIQVLMGMMAIVLTLATIDLGWIIIKDLKKPPFLILSVDQLLELFGLFMLVVIGLELLETIMKTIMKTYITRDMPHYEVVLAVAIIAISRKIIVLDIKEVDGLTILGIAAIVLALTAGFYMMKKSQQN